MRSPLRADLAEKLNEGLEEFRALVTEVVRDEQFRDQLTGLKNGQAFVEALSALINHARQDPFWIAFIEVDRMKRLNDAFSHERVNTLLKDIAVCLERMSTQVFPDGAIAYRASGDEFFLIGRITPGSDLEMMGKKIDFVRESISQIEVKIDGVDELLKCTVSIGWLPSMDISMLGREEILDLLERVVGVAKRSGRNKTVRYEPQHANFRLETVRSSCPECKAAFTCDDTAEALGMCSLLYCPICGHRSARPPLPIPTKRPMPKDI